MENLLDTAPCGFVTFGDNGAIVEANRTLTEWLGYAPGELTGCSIESILTLAARIFYQTHFFPLIRLHGRAEEIFFSLRARGGADVPVLANAVRRVAGDRATTVCVFVPVHQRQQYEDELLKAKRAAEEALRSNEALLRTQHELERQAHELDRQLSRLRQRNEELTRFSRILSHDLREPVRKMLVFADVLLQENLESLSPNALWSVEALAAQSARINDLLTGLQQYLALDADPEPVEGVNLNGVLQSALRRVEAQAEGVAISVSAETLPSLPGRRRELEMLFYQLLDNAVKFRKPGTPAQVRVEAEIVQHNTFQATPDRFRYVDFVQIVVTDDGIGFERRYAQYIFEALKKLDPNSDGLGFGLALCKKIVGNHFGTLTADAQPGAGARFTMLLPLQQ